MTCEIELRDVIKGYTLDQDKLVSPAETVRRFRERLEATGLDILEKTVRIDNGRLGIPVYFSLCGRDAEAVIGTKKQMGKGGTPVQAEASAVMELAERFSFFSFSANPGNFIRGTYAELEDRALPYDLIALSVHDDSGEAEAVREVFARLPMRWCPAYNLTRGREILVPFDWFFAINEFNGPSAGNCPEEALLQGICEVVERHTSSLISRGRLKTASLGLGSVTDGVVLDMLGKYEKAGVKLFVTDFSLNTGIPGVGVLAQDPATFPDRSEIVWTAGTTPCPQKALSRALSEVAQLAGDFNSGSNYVASGLPKFKDLSEADFVTHPGREIEISDLPDLSNPNLRVEVENCISALASIGLEVLCIETTHEKLRIPAFYTIIPGAHFRERAAGTSVGMFTAKLISQQADPSRALGDLGRMDRLVPGKYYVRFFEGLIHFNRADPGTALLKLEEALRLDPKEEDIPTIYSYMGQCLKEMEKYPRAIEALKKGAALDSERTDIYNLMGFCHFKQGEHEEAIRCFEKVLALDPSSAIDYANIASNYREMGDKEKAIHYYKLALELDSTIDFARDNLERLGKALKNH